MAYLDDAAFVLNIQPIGLPTIVRLSQNENGRRLYFTIIGNETAIPSGVTVTLSGTKPDGVVYSKVGSISNGVVLINEDTQLTAAAGNWDAKIKIVSGGQTVATGRVRFIIDADPVAPGSVPSDSQLEGLVAEAEWYAENARSAAYGSPLVASTVAGMTDHTRVYVYTGSETGYTAGNWYYWNGSAWTSGGVYNSTALQTDTTLAIPGMAADAKSTGDAIGNLDTRLDTAEDDITDVKSDFSLLEADLEGETEVQEEISFTYGYYIDVGSVSTVDINSPVADYRYKYAIVDCVAGDKFLINAYGGNAPRAYCFINASNAKISASDSNTNVINTVVTAPANSAKIIINDRFTDSSDLKSYKILETEGIGDNFVRFDKSQDKTEEEKAQARENIGVVNGLTDEAKDALMTCFAHVAWTDEYGQDYYDDLYEALYGEPPTPTPTPTFSYGVYEPESLVNGQYIDTDGTIKSGTVNQSYYIEDYIPVVRSNYWIGYQPPRWRTDSSRIWSESNWRVSEYDINKQFIKQTQFAGNANGAYSARIINFESNTKYIRLGWYDGYASAGYTHSFDIENPTTITELPMESGDVNATTGQNAEQSVRIRTVGYIPMTGSISLAGCPFAPTWASINQDCVVGVRCYDSNKNYLGYVSNVPITDTTISLLANTAYVRMIMQIAGYNFSDFKYLVGYLYTINNIKYYVTQG